MQSKTRKVLEMPKLPTPMEPVLTREQAAERLQVEPGTIYELTRARCKNPLKAYRVGKYLRFRESDIEAYLQDHAK